MKESVAVAKQADAKKGVSPTKSSDSSILHLRDESERQLGSLRGVIGNIRRDGGKPSVESIATELSGMHTAQRAPALLALQQTHGNRYVQRVVAGIQAKLKIGQPGDIYEQEADRVADAVMRMPEPGVQRQFELEEEETLQIKPLANEIAPLVQVQRQKEPEEEVETLQAKPLTEQITPLVQRQVEEEAEEFLQAKELPVKTSEATPNLEDQINVIKGSGEPLSNDERAYFEPRFRRDLSDVRIHNDSMANELAQSVNAEAFTCGNDVVFGFGKYAPSTYSGKKLLAHEITHVVQQVSNPIAQIQRRPLRQDNNTWHLSRVPMHTHEEFRNHVFRECGWITVYRRDEGEHLNDLLVNHSNLAQIYSQHVEQRGNTGTVDLVLRLTRSEDDTVVSMDFSERPTPTPMPTPIPPGTTPTPTPIPPGTTPTPTPIPPGTTPTPTPIPPGTTPTPTPIPPGTTPTPTPAPSICDDPDGDFEHCMRTCSDVSGYESAGGTGCKLGCFMLYTFAKSWCD